MSRIQFAKRHGASCSNPRFAWSYINEIEKFVIFGAWDHETDLCMQKVFSYEWRHNENGNKNRAFNPSLRHVERIVEDGFRLFTFPMTAKNDWVNGHPIIDSFKEELTEKSLVQCGKHFFAVNVNPFSESSNENEQEYWEGAPRRQSQTSYERNPEARAICLQEYGCSCVVCDFNFQSTYGEMGRDYIHVHHLVPVSKRKTSYKVNPIQDLRPVCPNCHAMIHRFREPIEVEELVELIAVNQKT